MSQNIRILKWFNFFTDFKLYAPIAIIYFAQISGSFALGMSVFSVVMVSSALLEIPTGVFSDRIGRKRTIILGASAALISIIFYAIGSSFWILIIGAVLEGLARSFYSGNNDALLYDTLAEKNEEDKFPEFLGKTSKMFQLALAISAVLAGVFLFKWPLNLIFWISVIPQFICLILAFLIIEPKIHSKKSGNIYLHLKEAYLGFKHSRKLRLLSLSSIMSFGFGEASYQFQSAFFATVRPVWAVPFAKVLSNLGAAISFHYSGAVIKRFNVLKIMFLGHLYARLVVIFSAILSSVWSPIITSSTSLFYGIMVVGRDSLMQKEFKSEQRATMGSLNSFVGSLFFGLIAILIGLIADKMSVVTALILLQVVQFATLYIYFKLFKSHSS